MNIRQDAKHWNITKSINFFFFSVVLPQIPSHRNKVNAEQSTLSLQYNNQGGHATWYPRYLCLIVYHPPMCKLVPVNKATVTLANCMWTTGPQFVYYRLEAWIVVSTPPRASHLSLRYSQQNICTALCFRTTLITNAAPLREREGFSKTDSTQYCNSTDTQNPEGAQLLAAPPMHKIQQNGSIKDYLNHTDKDKERN